MLYVQKIRNVEIESIVGCNSRAPLSTLTKDLVVLTGISGEFEAVEVILMHFLACQYIFSCLNNVSVSTISAQSFQIVTFTSETRTESKSSLQNTVQSFHTR